MQFITVVSILSFFSTASSLAVERSVVHDESTISPRQFCSSDGDCFGGANCCSGSCQFGSCRMDGTCDASNDCYGFCGNDPNGKACDVTSTGLLASIVDRTSRPGPTRDAMYRSRDLLNWRSANLAHSIVGNQPSPLSPSLGLQRSQVKQP
ncbi:hypothetical protein LA080_004465 [Diaporthe eres]|nr:hypothetical protein LA080_004465 [Diaporthe eres]